MKKLIAGLIFATVLISSVSAFMGYGYDSNYGITEILQNSQEILNNATLVEIPSPTNTTYYSITYNDEEVGKLWKNVDLKELTIGDPRFTMWGVVVPLYSSLEEYVGNLYLDWTNYGSYGRGYPMGHMGHYGYNHGPQWCHNY
ncbi:hypothetical protein [Methanothermococcus thermolithotrophicus]|jgi:hypothetical protein|uniref:hypothetical protein n=1 Tax=Methanothermococcus thermolithotrophicus TaxID=2186 RepID=UPI0003724EEE|nr:hypothetical protein [Methanothermococcus thermolithotrophicus]MDK2987889.1 hypothetical protein [Methanothermococcus sp.]